MPGWDLIAHSMTCTHTWEMTNQHTHCGGCSQCIDRRFAVVAAKADQYDPADHYKVDVFTQSRNKGDDKIMAAAYLERANQVKSLTDVTQFISSYAEVSRVFRYLEGSTAQAAQRVPDTTIWSVKERMRRPTATMSGSRKSRSKWPNSWRL